MRTGDFSVLVVKESLRSRCDWHQIVTSHRFGQQLAREVRRHVVPCCRTAQLRQPMWGPSGPGIGHGARRAASNPFASAARPCLAGERTGIPRGSRMEVRMTVLWWLVLLAVVVVVVALAMYLVRKSRRAGSVLAARVSDRSDR